MRSTNGINKEILVSYAGADKDITIPSNVTELYLNSLSDCELTNVKLNDGLERIDTSALANNKLTKLVIPSSVIIISATALQGNSFEEIVVKGKKEYPVYRGPINIVGNSTWIWPTNSGYYISSSYGWRWGRLHAGVDIAGTGYGSPIYVVNDGVVTKVGYNNVLGYYIEVNHNNGIYTVYFYTYS